MITRFKITLFVFVITGFNCGALNAQTDEPQKVPERRRVQVDPVIATTEVFSIGAHLGLGLVQHSGTFKGLPGVPTCCPQYDGGSGVGPVLGLDISFPIAPSFRLLGRLSFQGLSGTFEAIEPTTIRIENEAVATAFRHEFSATLSMIALEPIVEWRFAGGFSAMVGGRVGYVTGGTYTQKEELGDKSIPYVYLNGRSIYSERSGNLQDMSALQFGAIIGARYYISVGNTVNVIPEIAYAPTFSQLRSDMEWGASSLRFGATVMLTILGKDVIASPVRPQ